MSRQISGSGAGGPDAPDVAANDDENGGEASAPSDDEPHASAGTGSGAAAPLQEAAETAEQVEPRVTAPRTSGASGPSNTADDATSGPDPEDATEPAGVAAPADAAKHGATDSDDATRPTIVAPGDDDPPADGAATAHAGSTATVTARKALPAGDAKPRKRRGRRAKYVRRACYVLAAMIFLPVIGFVIAYLMTPIPSSAQAAAEAEPSTFFYRDGKTVIARTGTYNRRPVKLSEVPKSVRDAVISAENRSFYSDPGVSLKGSARAVWAAVSGGSTQGGSTITQQMVRNYYSGLSQKRTVSRKLKEIMIALKVGREKDKDWILQQYLNTIYYGRDAYGIEAAAKAYYNKDVGGLTTAEGAYLAAAIQVPTYAADLSDPNARAYMQFRWKYVVDGMVRAGNLSAQQAAAMTFPAPGRQKQKSIFAGDKGYMVHQAKVELRRLGYTDNQINMGGLRIRTTFDKDLMAAARRAVENNMPQGVSKKVMAGLVSVDPRTGEINAFYGGRDYLEREFDSAFDATVQAGSGFKPYVLAAALKDGMSLDDYVDGSSPQTFAGQPIQNNDDENFGEVNLVTATEHSINTAYMNIGKKVGNDKVISLAENLGIPAAQLEPHRDAATLPLGVADVSVEQQAAAYAAFASEGVYHAPHVIKSVTDRNGDSREITVPGRHVFSVTVARDATYAMQKVIDAGTGINASLPDRSAAGKTGTTSDGKQIWFNGFIPQLAASVAIFRSDNKPLQIPGYSAYGGDLPARIWRSYLIEADRDMPVREFGDPSVDFGGDVPPSASVPAQPRPHPTPGRPSISVPPPTSEPTHEPTTAPPEDPPTGQLPQPTVGPQQTQDPARPIG